tara:strand:+ start:586 stop:1455 length:870 start_codon:yes stop_codon:yes gene_type:complete
MRLITLIIFFLLPIYSIQANPSHTVQWQEGVNLIAVQKWSSALEKISNVSSTTYFYKKQGGKDNLHIKKHRDLIVWIPETTDLTKKVTVVLWFHGHHGFHPTRTFQDRTLKQLVPFAKSKNIVLVLPEMPWSIYTKTPTKRNSLLWEKPGDFIVFLDQVKQIIKSHQLSKVGNSNLGQFDYKVVGHSAGGSTIKRLGITGDLCKIKPSLIVWSDSTYGRWLDDAWHGCLSKTKIKIKVFVYQYGSPRKQSARFISSLENKPDNISIYIKRKGWSHKLIGNHIIVLSELL